jgi:hypothetical protein
LPPDSEDNNFESVTHDLIVHAINDKAANEAEELLAWVPPAIVMANQQQAHCLVHTQMLLATLFNFDRLDNGLDFYWTGTVKNLDADACEQAFFQQDVLQVPAMPDASSIVSTSSSSSLA